MMSEKEALAVIRNAIREKATTLNLYDNHLTTLPAEIAQLTNLQTLYLFNNQLTTLPAEISKLTNLQTLNLSNNQLTTLPAEITQLTNLQTLNLSDNQLTTLPAEITQLTELRELYLSNNQLTTLPAEIAQLTNLQWLDLRGNPLPLPPEVLNKVDDPVGLLTFYFEAQKSDRPLCEAKMLLVGQGFAGKTTLRRALMGEPVNAQETKTDGIERNRWKLPIDTDEITINVWDFGGQEIMHSTHQFFLTERSLYLLVLNARQNEIENRLEYWLKIIQTFGGNAPVLIVINKSEEHTLLLDEKGLREKYPHIKGILRTAACPKDPAKQFGIAELRAAICREINGLENLRAALPESCFAVKEALETMPKNYISQAEYYALCNAKEVPTDLHNFLLDLLNDLGTALNYRKHKHFAFTDTNVLNPEWVTQGVYKILNYPLMQWRRQAVLQTEMLPAILPLNAYPPEKYPFLLGMMEQFEICYCLDGDKYSEFLFPDLLSPEERYTGDWNNNLLFEYKYEVWIQSILTRFIVRMARYIKANTVWHKGVLLEREGMRALVKADPEEKHVAIWVEGVPSRRREMLGMIRREFETIHSSFENLKYKEWVPVPGNPGINVGYRHLLDLEQEGKTTYEPEDMKGKSIVVRELLDGVIAPEERSRIVAHTEKAPEPAPLTIAEPILLSAETEKKDKLPLVAGVFVGSFIAIFGTCAGIAKAFPDTNVYAVFGTGTLIYFGLIITILRYMEKLDEKNYTDLMGKVIQKAQPGSDKAAKLPQDGTAITTPRINPKKPSAPKEKDKKPPAIKS